MPSEQRKHVRRLDVDQFVPLVDAGGNEVRPQAFLLRATDARHRNENALTAREPERGRAVV